MGEHFARRTLFVVGATAAVSITLLLTWYASSVWLLAFAGVLLGVLLKGLADLVRRYTRLSRGWALAVVATVLMAAMVALFWIAGATLISQGEDLAQRLPGALQTAVQRVSQWPLVRPMLGGGGEQAKQEEKPPREATAEREEATPREVTPPLEEPSQHGKPPAPENSPPATQASGEPTSQPAEGAANAPSVDGATVAKALRSAAPPVAGTLGTVLGSAINFVVSFVVVTVVAIYVAATPGTYASGLVMLVPPARRERAREVVSALVYTLQHWLIGQGITMLVVGVVTAAGLYFIGVKLWLLFGVLAAIFNFIPNFGPVISFVPALLVAWTDEPSKAAWVLGLYVVAQCLEGYVLTPIIQKRSVDTPPAVLIVSQVLFGVMFGLLGVMLAAPLTAVAIVLTKMLYVEDTLGDSKGSDIEEKPKVQRMADKLKQAEDEPDPK